MKFASRRVKFNGILKYILPLVIILTLMVIVSSSIGSANLGLKKTGIIIGSYIPIIGNFITFEGITPQDIIIISQIRLPRILLAIFVGIALASSGVVFQGVFRNPMADPYIIGVSAGASFGATIGILFTSRVGIINISYTSIFAFLGAIGVTFVVYSISRVGGRISVLTLLLSGVAISALLTAVNSFILIFRTHDMAKVVFWLMGGLTSASWQQVTIIVPLIIILLIVLAFYMRELNIISLGDERASQLGVKVEYTRGLLLILASLVAAAAVSVSGIIGFVGLVTPHVMRIFVGPDHKILYPTSAIAGGIVLLMSDTIARTVLTPREIPVGIITSIIGVPFFLYLLVKSKKEVF